MKISPQQIQWMAFGVGFLLFLKYVIFGLDAWNSVLHPERMESSDTIFMKPLLGVFS